MVDRTPPNLRVARTGPMRDERSIGTEDGRRPSLVLHVLGITLGVSGVGILLSAIVEAVSGGPHVLVMLVCGVVTATVGGTLWRSTMVPTRIELLDVFTTVTLAWLGLAVAGAFPYFLTGTIGTVDDAIFESLSGFTTTGATVLRPIEEASKGMLFWRSLTQWIGGMGVIVLVVAVLPAVGSGGMDLLQAEAPGPTGERLTPRVRHTARNLWVVYAGLTLVLAVGYAVAGMSVYDAVSHSLTTASTGGFSTKNASLGHYESALIEWIAIFGMFVAGGSFTLWYRLIRGKAGPLLASAEFRLYLAVIAFATAAVFVTADANLAGHDGVRTSLFTVLTVVSTTGYATTDFGLWNDAALAVLLLLMPLGAMAGSTSGGVKMIRLLAVASYAHRATLRQLHPRMVRPIRIGKAILDDDVTSRVLGFLVLALATFGSGALLIAWSGVDLLTALSASATAFGNVGPGINELGPSNDFLVLPRFARWVAIAEMLLGRLEIYPVLLALSALPRPGRLRRS